MNVQVFGVVLFVTTMLVCAVAPGNAVFTGTVITGHTDNSDNGGKNGGDNGKNSKSERHWKVTYIYRK